MKQMFKSKNFWVILIYILFLLIDKIAIDGSSENVWDNLKVRGTKIKNLFHV